MLTRLVRDYARRLDYTTFQVVVHTNGRDVMSSRHGVARVLFATGPAWQNGRAERFIRTIKEEEVDLAG